ncbi:hypothetical protein CTAYLR_000583 [Chrysophaeum taylorii]|uniref:PDZ-like domain-containing protein n=1 Tax=Chrysophaeum taylorii TaxID=2483200 RepID=A0AAD7UGZ4_9STRA|nr:hypothetical protein CTAYLR_000583 [Chrysophaeum taylorii]
MVFFVPSRLSVAVGGVVVAVLVVWRKKKRKWELSRILPAIVVIRVNYLKPFDGESAGSSQATGFVVDGEKGIILTNRHVVGCGPIRAEATFSNKEEVSVSPLYRDPVHDFALLRFDKTRLSFIRSFPEIELAPEAARVGLDIRVVGNDSGEKVSILSGTLARLDRNAPSYDGYDDVNTFYLSAASNTSGGSSGSPVLDEHGRAVALNAGGSTHSSASFYLPLGGVKRALDSARRGRRLDRGTLRVVWRYQTCDELRRSGLSRDTEKAVRRRAQGLLVVDQVVGPRAAKLVEVGDALIRVADGQSFPRFDELERALDSRVGRTVDIEVERGGKRVCATGVVEDLHALVPSEFVEFGGGVLHSISYQTQRRGNLEENGVYVACAGFVLDAGGVPSHSVITALNEHPTPTLDDFEAAQAELADEDRATIRFYHVGDRFNDQVATIRINRRWFPPLRWVRVDPPSVHHHHHQHDHPCWESREMPAPRSAAVGKIKMKPTHPIKTKPFFQRTHATARANRVVSSLCKVSFDVLHAIDGVVDWHFAGCGVVVDSTRGLVAVDRNTVVTSLGEASVTFAAAVEVPAKVVFAHPTHNFALVQYDPSVLEDDDGPSTAPFSSLEEEEEEEDDDLKIGDELVFVGLCRANPDQSLSQKVTVTEISCVNIAQARVPRFRATNEEIAKFDQVLNKSLGGVLVSRKGQVVATWACYSFYSWHDEKNYEAFHAVGVRALVDVVSRWNDFDLHSIGFGLKRIPLSTARTSLKLEDAWVQKLRERHPNRSQVLSVAQLAHDEASSDVSEGDLLLGIDGLATATFRDVETATRDKSNVQLTLWRDNAVKTVTLATRRVFKSPGTDRVVVWSGLLLQRPHRAVLEMGAPTTNVYCSYFLYGSPASFSSLKACRFVLQVDGTDVFDLDDFIQVVSSIPDATTVRLKTSDLQGQQVANTLKTDYTFWPSHQLVYRQGDWLLLSF